VVLAKVEVVYLASNKCIQSLYNSIYSKNRNDSA
jgi:hypothetical protein